MHEIKPAPWSGLHVKPSRLAGVAWVPVGYAGVMILARATGCPSIVLGCWVAPSDLHAPDIHPTQWRQINDCLERKYPRVD